jgi:hypothetical protein
MIEHIYNNDRIGTSLVKDGLISGEQLEEALELYKTKGGFIGQILVDNEWAFEEELLTYFMDRYALPYVPPAQFPINPESKKFIAKEIAEQYLLLPVDHIGYRLTVICPGPLEGAVLGNALEACRGWPVSYFLCNISELTEAIEKHYAAK